MDYKILSENTSYELQKSVNFWIGCGYVPNGNMSMKPEVSGFMVYESAEYCQPMIKRDKKP